MRSRRSFLSLPLVAPLGAWSASLQDEHRFEYEHVMGTSLDLAVWTPNDADAGRAKRAVLDEIDRLCTILSTYDPTSEISQFITHDSTASRSRELDDVLSAYEHWSRRAHGTISSRPAGRGTTLNVDALGKAYIIDRASGAARRAAPAVDGLLLNIGGDLVAWHRPLTVSIADPRAPHDNGDPLAEITILDAAVATSGRYARGAHIIDPRSGRPALSVASATVVAGDCVTANALATAICVAGPEEGGAFVDATPGAESLVVDGSGVLHRSAGFAALERPRVVRAAASEWPAGYEVTLALTVTGLTGFRARRPYVAVWVEDSAGQLVRILAMWGDRNRYLADLPTFWGRVGRDANLLRSVTRATRPPGRYQLAWNGFDNDGRAMPMGAYKIIVETNQQHGSYARQIGTITCGTTPVRAQLRATENFDAVDIQYGPRPGS